MATNDGGSAFPRHQIMQHFASDDFDSDRAEFRCESPGMSLRDYFAAKAMSQAENYLQSVRADSWDFEDMAGVCYDIADAMLKARGE